MTAREAIYRLHERGWSNSQIAAAMGRGRGQIINIGSGRASGAKLAPALEALSKRPPSRRPAPGVLPQPVARGAAKPPPKTRTTAGRGLVAERTTVGRGSTQRRISQSLPGHASESDMRRELLAYSNRRVSVTLVVTVNGQRRILPV
ncbi:MAG: hypothetical protein ACRD1G_11005, partial [Acidimicrobiales bacterium]